MKIALLRHCSGAVFPVSVMAVSGKWAMVRCKGAIPFCVMVKEFDKPVKARPVRRKGWVRG